MRSDARKRVAGMSEQSEGAEVETLEALEASIVAVLTEKQPVSYRPRTAIGEAREVLNRILASDWLAAREAAAEARGAQAEAWSEGAGSCLCHEDLLNAVGCICQSEMRRKMLRDAAAQVACVDPSRSDGGSTDPEVCQSADQTSAPSRVPGEES